MATMGSTTIPFKTLYGLKPNIIGFFSEFGLIGYVTKQYKFKTQMMDKTFKAMVVGYSDNHTRDMYK